MADSDEEGDGRKSRDKFKRERSDYGERHRRDTFSSRDDNPRRRSRDYRNDGRGDFSPPFKRSKRDNWGEGYGDGLFPRPWNAPREQVSIQPPPQPVHSGSGMLSFKQFLAQQDDNIDDTEAVQKYAEYKKEMKKSQLQFYFDKHKEEEWFRVKYHPVLCVQRQSQGIESCKIRYKAFIDLLLLNVTESVSLCMDSVAEVTRVMDSAVILMEGGTELDFKALDRELDEESDEAPSAVNKAVEKEEEEEETALEKYNLETKQNDGGDPSGTKEEEKANEVEEDKKGDDEETAEEKPDEDEGYNEEDKGEEANKGGGEGDGAKKEEGKVESVLDTVDRKDTSKQQGSGAEEDNSSSAPRPLHLTKSVYVRHIPPSISTTDIIEVCSRFTGYKRIALDGPDIEKGYEHRGWVTFSLQTNTREVISELCSIKNCQLTCMANRELTRRVKPATSYVYSRDVVVKDVQFASQLVRHFDSKQGLFEDPQVNPLLEEAQIALAGLTSSSAGESSSPKPQHVEEEEGSVEDTGEQWPVAEGAQLLQIVDCLLWYLRIVHSLDYYSGSVVAQEHEMPHRCGIVTVRPRHRVDSVLVQPDEVSGYLDNVKSKIQSLLVTKMLLTDEEVCSLGKKDLDSEVEKFISDNTKEISKEKYLCPLSGKKFRGPEFVRKHIFNKHGAKLEEAKQDVVFYNNYLCDSDRPMPLESEVAVEGVSGAEGFHGPPPADFVPWGNPHMMMFRREPPLGMFPPRGFPPDGISFRGRMRRRGRSRRMVEYNDLDAPADMEF